MKSVPHARGVNQALRSVRTATQKSLKALNQVASQKMAKGDYLTTEMLVARGKDIREFLAEVTALQKRWREVCGSRPRGSKKTVTPLWSYYQPILQALAQVGGESRRVDLEEKVGRLMSSSLLPGDQDSMARGRERWRVMIQRARRHLIAEGWIEESSGKKWRITDSGRRAADKPVTGDISAVRGSKGTRR